VPEAAQPGESAPAPVQQPPANRDALSEALVHNMLAELRSMRAVLEQRLAGLAWTELSRSDPAKVSALQTLLTAGFSGELARRLTDPMPDGALEADAFKWLVTEINRNLVTAGADNDIVERGGVYAVVGPTGVGKTTTTAKLAARAVVRHGADRVALLTTDTYRIGAHEQLRIYGRILGVSTSIVRDAAELKAALGDLRGKHMVLIDTIGMSQRDKLVAEQVQALTRSGGNVKRLLLLNATCNGDTLEDVVRCYEPASLEGCIVTKIDEAQSIGAALDVVVRHRLALHFVANGQRVPEDLHVPNRQYLIHRALRAAGAGSVIGLKHEEYPLLLPAAGAEERADAAGAFAARLGAYVA
jgi:flagellar biosynthesis protein FlhF